MDSDVTVVYRLRYSDYLRNVCRVIWFRPSLALGHLATLTIFPGGAVYLVVSLLWPGISLEHVFLVMALSVLVASMAMAALIASTALDGDLKNGVDRHVTLSQDGVDIASESESRRFAWTTISRIAETRQGFYFYRGKRMFWYLPRRALAGLPSPDTAIRILRSKAI